MVGNKGHGKGMHFVDTTPDSVMLFCTLRNQNTASVGIKTQHQSSQYLQRKKKNKKKTNLDSLGNDIFKLKNRQQSEYEAIRTASIRGNFCEIYWLLSHAELQAGTLQITYEYMIVTVMQMQIWTHGILVKFNEDPVGASHLIHRPFWTSLNDASKLHDTIM